MGHQYFENSGYPNTNQHQQQNNFNYNDFFKHFDDAFKEHTERHNRHHQESIKRHHQHHNHHSFFFNDLFGDLFEDNNYESDDNLFNSFFSMPSFDFGSLNLNDFVSSTCKLLLRKL